MQAPRVGQSPHAPGGCFGDLAWAIRVWQDWGDRRGTSCGIIRFCIQAGAPKTDEVAFVGDGTGGSKSQGRGL